MSRMRHFSVPSAPGDPRMEEESSDDDDAFTALSRKRPRSTVATMEKEIEKPQVPPAAEELQRPVASTSSNKRHHGAVSDARKANMDAILLELEATHKNRTSSNKHSNRRTHQPTRVGGSFVDPGDEHCTTNIFVGNLAPSVTEEQMTELFRQFGEHALLMLVGLAFLWMQFARETSSFFHVSIISCVRRKSHTVRFLVR